jgi:ADP-heptose:LPS heptosyltransferase
MKILIVRFSSIGDIVLTTPVIRCLKNQMPECELHYLTKKAYVCLLDHNPYLTKVWALDDDFRSLMTSLKIQEFDYIIDLHNNLRTRRVSLNLMVATSRLNKLNLRKWLLVHFQKDVLPNKHIVDRYLDVAKKFKIKNDHAGLDYHIPDKTNVDIELPKVYVCYAIGGQHNTKKLPADKIIQLCASLNQKVVLIGGKEDVEVGEQVVQNTTNAVSLCGKLSIHQSAMIIKDSQYVISHDTGMMHIASAFKKKIISIWGNTVPGFGMFPYIPGPGSLTFEVKNLSCRPCSKIGFDTCPKGHFDCMQKQDIDSIASLVEA